MIARYTLPEMGALWSDENRFRTWLEVELEVCRALARRGVIPPDDLKNILERADFDLERIEAIEAEVRHDVIAFLTSVAEKVGPSSRFIHYGLTSSDVVDTALSLLLVRAADRILERLRAYLEVLRHQALAHRSTVMVGRTHGIHAEPYLLGLKFLGWYAEMDRARERLVEAREAVRTGKLSGAVGTYAHLDPELEAEVLEALGLRPEPIATQVVPRDRHAQYVSALALLASGLDRTATEIRNLQRTELREVEEPFAKGQKGSSAMPHKRNPVMCENVSGLARIVRAQVEAALQNIVLWHERDISHSSVERVFLADGTILCDFMLHRMTRVVRDLHVYPDRMLKNLDLMHGLVFSQAVLLALTRAGLSREDAYRLVQRNAMKVWNGEGSLLELLEQDPEVRKVLSGEQLRECFDAHHLLRHTDVLYRRVLGGDPEPS